MRVVTSPDKYMAVPGELDLFLAGGITGCPDWQAEILKLLEGNLVVYNLRRPDFPIGNPAAAQQQITWEFYRLRWARLRLFWFSSGSLNPIVLYELGMWGNSTIDRIFVGCDFDYARRQDVIFQTCLARPDVEIANTLEDLAGQVNRIVKPVTFLYE